MFVDRSSMQWSDRHPFESPRKHEFLSVSIRVHPRPISLSRIVDNGDSRPRYFTSQIIESHASSRIQSVTYAIPLPTFCYILTRRRFATAAFFQQVSSWPRSVAVRWFGTSGAPGKARAANYMYGVDGRPWNRFQNIRQPVPAGGHPRVAHRSVK